MSEITLSEMSGPAQRRKAAREERLAESQANTADPAISPADETAAVSQPETPIKRTTAALDRHIAATAGLIDRLTSKLKAAQASRDSEVRLGIPSLTKSLQNAQERKAMLERLRAKEEKYVD